MKFPGWGRAKEELVRRGRYGDEIREATNPDATFRRGATLKTFHADREKSERQKERDLRTYRRKVGVILLVVSMICGLGLVALTQFNGSFSDVGSNAPTLKSADVDRYKKLVSEYFSHNPLERFNFARRDDNLTHYVAQQAPEVEKVEVSQSGFLLGKLLLVFREPMVMWTADGQTNYVDGQGVVFTRNYFAVPSVTVSDSSGAGMDGGRAVTSSRFLGFIGQVIKAMAKQGNTVERVVIPVGAIRYIEFYLVGKSYPFRAQIDRDAVSQANDIVAMIKYLDSRQVVPTYVDCRSAGKAYWK